MRRLTASAVPHSSGIAFRTVDGGVQTPSYSSRELRLSGPAADARRTRRRAGDTASER